MSNPRSAELRKAPRLKSLIGARIVFNNGSASLDCVIRDLSGTGAKLALSGPVAVPDAFDLIIPQKGVTHRAKVAWRQANEIGVAFVEHGGAIEPSGNVAALRRRIRELEAENARLQSRITQLTEG